MTEAMTDAERIAAAVELAFNFGGTDGGHHKMWLIDQMVRVLLGAGYTEWRNQYEDNGEYVWDDGIAP